MDQLPIYVIDYIITLAINHRCFFDAKSYREGFQLPHNLQLSNTTNIGLVCHRWHVIVKSSLSLIELHPGILRHIHQRRLSSLSSPSSYLSRINIRNQLARSSLASSSSSSSTTPSHNERLMNMHRNSTDPFKRFDTNILLRLLKLYPTVKRVYLSYFQFYRPGDRVMLYENRLSSTTNANTNTTTTITVTESSNSTTTTTNQNNQLISEQIIKQVKERNQLYSSIGVHTLQIVECTNFRSISFVDYILSTNCLTNLVIDQCNLRDWDLSVMAYALKASSNPLSFLSLCRNCISDEGAYAISQLVMESRSIRDIYLSHNSIGSAGATYLAQSLLNNRSLNYLALNDNSISIDGAIQLIATLETNQTLLRVDISDNYFDPSQLFEKIKTIIPLNKSSAIFDRVHIDLYFNQNFVDKLLLELKEQREKEMEREKEKEKELLLLEKQQQQQQQLKQLQHQQQSGDNNLIPRDFESILTPTSVLKKRKTD